MKRHAIVLFLFALGSAAHGQVTLEGDALARARWRDLTYDRQTTHTLFVGDQLWVGGVGGGVYRWNTANPTARRPYVKYTKADGLPDVFVNDMAAGPGGEIYVATWFGLGVFDGQAWSTLDSSSSPLLEDRITAVAVEPSGVLWVGTFDSGLFRRDGGVWTHFDVLNSGLSDRFVTSIEVGTDGALWLGVWGDGVDRFDEGVWTNFKPGNSGLFSVFAYVKAVDPFTGAVWIWCYDDDFMPDIGTVRFDGTNWTQFVVANSGIHSDYIHSVRVDPSGDTWFQGFDAVSRWDGSTWTTFSGIPSPFDFNMPKGKSIAVRDDGELWIGTADGIARFEGAGFTGFATPELADNHVRAVLADASGAWFGHRAGLQHRGKAGRWEHFTEATSGLPDDDVEALAAGPSGALWIGTRGGLALFDGTTWIVFTPQTSGIHTDKVLALDVSRTTGEAWFASGIFGGGVGRFHDGQWSVFGTAAGVPSSFVSAVAIDEASGDVWVGTSAGLGHFDGLGWTTYTTADGLASNVVNGIDVAADGTVWIATAAGVNQFDGNTFTTWTFQDGLAENAANEAFVDQRGIVWIGHPNQGVSRFDGSAWTTFGLEDGLPNNRIVAVSQAPGGDVWFGTDFGAAVYREGRAPRLETGRSGVTGR